jgi:hypothetical protein
MSKNAYNKMRSCGNCPFFKDFKRFANFYGTATYSDKFILSAFKGSFANFTHGDADFRNYDYDARAGEFKDTRWLDWRMIRLFLERTHNRQLFTFSVAAIKTATSFLTITQYILQELEHSVDKCEQARCKEERCLTNAIQSMEAAVAYYTGSLEGPTGSGQGYLLYALADDMCKVFKTCGPNGDKSSGSSKVNLEIFNVFRDMQANIRSHRCTPARINKERISILMSIPLVQATLQQAFIGDRQAGASLVEEATGAALAASVVPMVGNCKTSDGEIIYENMKTNRGYKTDFAVIKATFERNYDCLSIKCADIGGYWFNGITGGFYMDGFYPCGIDPPKPWSPGQVVGFVVAALAGVVLLYGVFKGCRYFHFFGMCKTLQKKLRRKPTTATVRSSGVQA